MARRYGKIYERIWADPDWRKLDVDAQHLYLALISQPSTNSAGLLPLQERRWASCAADWNPTRIRDALTRLIHDRYIVVDEDTEELFVRSFIRNDEGFRIPGMLKSILRLAEAAQSPLIRSALAAELARLPRLEGKKADEGTALIRATRVALGASVEPIPEPIRDAIPSEPMPEPMPEPIGEPYVAVAVAVARESHVLEGGGRAPHPDLFQDQPPPCEKHTGMAREDIPPCRRCGLVREAWEAERADHERAARAEAAKPKPPCRDHPGEDLATCRGCAADRKAAR